MAALDQIHLAVILVFIESAVVWQDAVVDYILCLFGMQLAGFAVKSKPVVIVDAVCNVACFLNISKIASTAYCVDPSCRKEEYITLLDVIASKRINYVTSSDIIHIL